MPLTLGTQTGGSVIRPASYCGAWAIKPTWNAVSADGIKPCAASFDTLGWYGRTAADLDLLAEVYGIRDDLPLALNSVEGMKIALCHSPAWDMAGPATRAAMDAAASRLRAAGAEVTPLDLPEAFTGLTVAHKTIMQAEMRAAFLPEWREFGEALYPELAGILRNDAGRSRADLVAALDLAAACRARFDALSAPFDAVLTPSTPGTAPLGPEDTGAATFNRIWTLLHMPCVNVPGLMAEGLPIGVTLTGPRFSDRRLLRAAALTGAVIGGVAP